MTLTQAEKLRPHFSKRRRGQPRRCLIGVCNRDFVYDTGDSSLAYHVCRDHRDIVERDDINHPRLSKRQRSDSAVMSASSASSSPVAAGQMVLIPDVLGTIYIKIRHCFRFVYVRVGYNTGYAVTIFLQVVT